MLSDCTPEKKKKNQVPKGPNWVPKEHVMQILMSVTKKMVQVESNEKKKKLTLLGLVSVCLGITVGSYS